MKPQPTKPKPIYIEDPVERLLEMMADAMFEVFIKQVEEEEDSITNLP